MKKLFWAVALIAASFALYSCGNETEQEDDSLNGLWNYSGTDVYLGGKVVEQLGTDYSGMINALEFSDEGNVMQFKGESISFIVKNDEMIELTSSDMKGATYGMKRIAKDELGLQAGEAYDSMDNLIPESDINGTLEPIVVFKGFQIYRNQEGLTVRYLYECDGAYYKCGCTFPDRTSPYEDWIFGDVFWQIFKRK